MDHLIVRETPAQVNWTFNNIAGDAISLSGYNYRLFYSMGAASSLATSVTFLDNVLSWTFTPDKQWKLGYYDLTLELYDGAKKVINISYPKAFLLIGTAFSNSSADETSTAQQNDLSTLNIVSAIDLGRFDVLPISWNKLDENLQNIIVTGSGQHGIPLSTQFGDSDQLGITQRKLTESRDDLQAQINAIVSDKATVSLGVSPAAVFVNEESTISLTATSNTDATSIKIMKGSSEIASGSGKTLSGSDANITPTAVGSIGYSAVFTIAGVPKTATNSVSVVKPIYYGAGAAYTDATNRATARTSPAGNYTIAIPQGANLYIWFRVPDTMSINKATMGGFGVPLEAPTTADGYKIYRSSSPINPGSYTITIS